MEEMRLAHQSETAKLHKKLVWYCENQELLDRDTGALKNKREEVKELRDVIARLEQENNRLRKERTTNRSEKNTDNTTINDLKRQVFFIYYYPIRCTVGI